ncbi:MAG: 50S ribosomal protein L4 [candidate division WOR-3 bacterium]
MPVEVKCYNKIGKEEERITLEGELFESKFDETAVYYAVLDYLAKQRQFTAKVKNRGEVAGSGRKPWRQKGTGRARAGSRRSPLWVGGGVVFGPRPREVNFKINKKIKRKALKSAISKRVSDGHFIVIEEERFDKPSTKKMADTLKAIGIYGEKILLLYKGENENFYKSCRNIEGVDIIPASLVNAYKVLENDWLVLTKDALGTLVEVFK